MLSFRYHAEPHSSVSLGPFLRAASDHSCQSLQLHTSLGLCSPFPVLGSVHRHLSSARVCHQGSPSYSPQCATHTTRVVVLSLFLFVISFHAEDSVHQQVLSNSSLTKLTSKFMFGVLSFMGKCRTSGTLRWKNMMKNH